VNLARHDYYNVLGITKNATTDEIKRAYRKLALKYHPDRNPEDLQSASKFQEATKAYEALSNSENRLRYDRLGPFYTENGRPPNPDELSEVLSDIVGGIFGKKSKSVRGDDLRFSLSVTLEEVANGTTKTICVPRQVRCDNCDMSGADPNGGKQECRACDGSGRSTTRRVFRQQCAQCYGVGYIVIKACPLCGGEGHHGTEGRLKVKVPKGAISGLRLRLSGRGNHGTGRAPSGDLFVVVEIEPHPIFKRRGADIICDLPLTLSEACLGGTIRAPTLGGSEVINVEPGAVAGTMISLKSKGLPHHEKPKSRGDLHYIITPQAPRDLSETEASAIAALESSLSPENYPTRLAFDRWVINHRTTN
jgi:molecular chaperone DnaJ